MTSNKIAKNNKQPINLLKDPVAGALKRMTIPMIYGMILLMTFNLVDTFFVSMLGTQPLAAISFTFPVTFTVISLMIGLGIGTSAVIAKFLGHNDHDSAKDSATAALYMSAIVVIGLSFIGYCFTDELFTLLGSKASLLPLIHEYMDIWYLGSVFLIGPMIGNAVLRASGDVVVGDNEPYCIEPLIDYSIPFHALRRGLLHLQVEFRQDEIADPAAERRWALRFAEALTRCEPSIRADG